jgi:nitroreductase
MDDKTLRGLIQKRGHSLDLYFGSGNAVPAHLVKDLEFLFREVRRRKITLDEPLRWALELLAMARYGLRPATEGPPQTAGPADGVKGTAEETALTSVVRTRRSVRKWTSEPVYIDEILGAIDLAKWAPSSCNRQLWQTLLIVRKEDVQFISRYFDGTFYLQAPLLILVLMNTGLYGDSEAHFAYLDGGAFIQNLLLLLHAKGYGACWLGFTGWNNMGRIFAAPERYEAFYEHFGLRKDQVPISMVAVGRPLTAPKAPPRQGLDSIVIRRS